MPDLRDVQAALSIDISRALLGERSKSKMQLVLVRTQRGFHWRLQDRFQVTMGPDHQKQGVLA